MSLNNLLNIRCCCNPTKVIGAIDPTKAPHGIELGEVMHCRMTYENGQLYKYREKQVAIKSNDLPTEYWQNLPSYEAVCIIPTDIIKEKA